MQVCGSYPKVTLITSEIDDRVDMDTFQLVPGAGSYGDRYFCD